jgi:hypothetical protein
MLYLSTRHMSQPPVNNEYTCDTDDKRKLNSRQHCTTLLTRELQQRQIIILQHRYYLKQFVCLVYSFLCV